MEDTQQKQGGDVEGPRALRAQPGLLEDPAHQYLAEDSPSLFREVDPRSRLWAKNLALAQLGSESFCYEGGHLPSSTRGPGASQSVSRG